MGWVSGKIQKCGVVDCPSTSFTDVRESFDEIDLCFVGEQRCDGCGARYLYTRRANTPEEIAMVKKVTSKNRFDSPRKGARRGKLTESERDALRNATHRVTTHKPNGGMSESTEVAPAPVTAGEAIRQAIAALGKVHVDDDLAPQQLRELAECYERIAEEQAAYMHKAEAAKVAKKSLDSATNLLLEKVRTFTHPTPMPLFDAVEAEKDRENMVNGGTVAEGAPA